MMRAYIQTLLITAVCMLLIPITALAVDTPLLKAKISDIGGLPLEGAKLFLYDSLNVRRPADFISPLSDRTGQVEISLPPGKYWAIARFKSDGKYGPLMPGDKHSGEPQEIDMNGDFADAAFVVADIRELGQKKRTSATDARRLKGRLINVQGTPVTQAFAFANISKEFKEFPDYISAWSGDDGMYEVYLPPGVIYYVGVSRQFPLKYQEEKYKPLVIEPGKIDIAIDINLTVE